MANDLAGAVARAVLLLKEAHPEAAQQLADAVQAQADRPYPKLIREGQDVLIRLAHVANLDGCHDISEVAQAGIKALANVQHRIDGSVFADVGPQWEPDLKDRE